jgi:hypothetical protein
LDALKLALVDVHLVVVPFKSAAEYEAQPHVAQRSYSKSARVNSDFFEPVVYLSCVLYQRWRGLHRYNANRLRNVGLKNARTAWVLCVDVDMEPSEGLSKRLDAAVQVKVPCDTVRAHRWLTSIFAQKASGSKVALVLPAFEYTEARKRVDRRNTGV